ncbi:MAG TPA: HypC/HybG/HupF family hydrogenase formation chaperone [Nevskiaceae bacterium]|nr:HypC/HybG/HupF family hydrogenase formation chaperone [Nevskiaceae bacterium]
MCLGIPGQVVEIVDEVSCVGVVDICGVRRQVNLSCVVDENHAARDCVGAWVLVHVGFAMSRIDEAEARATLELLQGLGDLQAELVSLKVH